MGKKLSRRLFLQSSVAIAATGALAGCSKNDGETVFIEGGGTSNTPALQEEKLVAAVCRPNCFSACYLNAHVRNGKIVKISRRELPDKRYDRVCLRGLSQVQRLYSPSRLTTPLIRTGERGKGEFRSATWEEAITYICDRIKEVQATHGAQAFCNMAGSANYAAMHKAVFSRFLNVVNASAVNPMLDWCQAIGMARTMGVQTIFPFAHTSEPADLANAKTIIAWGGNPTEAQIQNWHFIADAIEHNDATLIAIDVAFSNTAARAQKFVHLRPGSDTLLALSMLHEILSKDSTAAGADCWVDYDYMVKNTVAPFLVHTDDASSAKKARFVRYSDLDGADKVAVDASFGGVPNNDAFIAYNGTTLIATEMMDNVKHVFKAANLSSGTKPETGGCQFTSIPALTSTDTGAVKTAYELLKERAAAHAATTTESETGVHPDIVKEMARIYATNKPSTIIAGYAPDHYANGHHAYHAMVALAAITGNCGVKGASVGAMSLFGISTFNGSAVSAPVVNATQSPSIPYPVLPTVFNIDNAAAPDAYGNGGPDELYKGLPCKIRAMFVSYANPISTFVDPMSIIKMFTMKEGADYKMKLVATADYELTDTGMYCDVVLPLSHWFEQEDICSWGNHPYMTYQPKSIEAYGGSKSDMEIAHMLGKEMGFGQHFTKTADQYMDSMIDETTFKNWYTGIVGAAPESSRVPTFNTLKREGAMRLYPGSISKEYCYPEHRKKSPTGHDDMVFGTQSPYYSAGSGRLEFYTDSIWVGTNFGQATGLFFNGTEAGVNLDLERLPGWEEPAESWPGRDPKYPYQLYSERPRWRVHSQWFNTPWLREFDPYPTVKINTTDAQNAQGGPIVTGNLIKISNARGHCLARALVTVGIRQGVINVPRGWQAFQHVEHFGPDGGSSQFLTSRAIHPVHGAQSFYDACVNIEKVQG